MYCIYLSVAYARDGVFVLGSNITKDDEYSYYFLVRCFYPTFTLIHMPGEKNRRWQQRIIERTENIKFILCKINTHLLGAGIETSQPTNDNDEDVYGDDECTDLTVDFIFTFAIYP